MYRFPPAPKFQFLVSQELSGVLVGLHSSVLHFLDGGSITLEGSGEINRDGNRLNACDTGGMAIRWLGASLEAIIVESDICLCLVWSNGDQLRLFDDSDDYETFLFVNEDKSKCVVV
ncbi:MAG: hypothetical protein LPK90_11415 [Alphaproteobacteria bacterium]|nr:hypothetical protein [Alphaproteobacteria bacterium]MDX5494248.1 hypothetical protein [Alphaproteobacteria bacterium]